MKQNIWFISFLLLLHSHSFGRELASPEEYFNARKISKHSVIVMTDISVLKPPHSIGYSLGKDISLHVAYKQNLKDGAIPLSMMFDSVITFDSKWKPHSFSITPGLRFPNTNRKSSLFFILNIGFTLSKKKESWITPYFEIGGQVKLRALSRNTFALIGLNARYEPLSHKWWNDPHSINLLAGLDFGI